MNYLKTIIVLFTISLFLISCESESDKVLAITDSQSSVPSGCSIVETALPPPAEIFVTGTNTWCQLVGLNYYSAPGPMSPFDGGTYYTTGDSLDVTITDGLDYGTQYSLELERYSTFSQNWVVMTNILFNTSNPAPSIYLKNVFRLWLPFGSPNYRLTLYLAGDQSTPLLQSTFTVDDLLQ